MIKVEQGKMQEVVKQAGSTRSKDLLEPKLQQEMNLAKTTVHK